MTRIKLIEELKNLASAGGVPEKDKLERIKLLLPDSDDLTRPHLADPRVQDCLESLADTFEDPASAIVVLMMFHFFKPAVTERVVDLACGLHPASQYAVYISIINNLSWRLRNTWSTGLLQKPEEADSG